MAKLSIAVVTYNSADEICACLKSIIDSTSKIEYTLTVIDNASSDNTVEVVRTCFPTVNIIETQENRGFGCAHNRMLGSDSEYHAVVNPDITVCGEVMAELADFLDRNPQAAAVTPRVLNPDGTEQFLPKRKPTAKYMLLGRLSRYFKPLAPVRDEYTRKNENFSEPAEIEFCTGCFMFMRTEYFRQAGGFDESFFMYMEDADLSDRLRDFGKIYFYPGCSVIHNWGGGSSESLKLLKYHFRSMFKYFKKQKGKR